MKVIRDTKEKENHGWFFDEMETRHLVTGDYSLDGFEDKLTIERKRSTGELAKNVIEPRFERELERMQEYKWSYMIFEFDMIDLMYFPENSGIPKSKWDKLRIKPKFLLKKVAEYQTKYKCNIIFASRFGQDVAEAIFREVLRSVS